MQACDNNVQKQTTIPNKKVRVEHSPLKKGFDLRLYKTEIHWANKLAFNFAHSCWGLDLRVKPPPSEMLPNSFAGLQREEGEHTRR